ncbi:DUF3375 domain-containing protein [Fusobacterium necrophorum]|uniref:DUF3375 domain-containing protein n=4 Tax=Fusobacterium necrophorum TaxID=859 RepID=A0AB73BT89_9FUSO|nr:DUF3375 domain-containing protein [Fusobacterium necrophorum]AYZ74415.1 DUF3375 domain-containing protein [Fusobacterium necrophorum]AZW09699.1 DUF3375 domain-containing protein [Fusobacterium necrophorum subsp. necrophorum]KDE60865.1 hypothetical protein FUSO3_11690 [Fusobacterium necrophorum BL]KDE61497.1 hypothetical protein FUSO5_11655 [Fusobacterium necrophorum BFTR-1]KDE64495.1 hypothetical protein FUSO4_07905 [Fusobacterium necrophorum DJ-1]
MKNDLIEHMSYHSLHSLRRFHPAWKLMAADNAPFFLSFFFKEFIFTNEREIPEHILMNHLDDFMEEIPYIRDNKKKAKEYLVEWSDDSSGWLRRFYPRNSDEIHYDLTSSTQEAIDWIISLKSEQFIGTESRLMMIFGLFHEILSGTETDPELKIQELERKKLEIEREIELVKQGKMKNLESTQIKERFLQASSMSREILSDFRAVEQNFRNLNRTMQEKIASWEGSKGELIEEYFSEQDDIYKSDQGKSFEAFFKFIMSNDAKINFEESIEKLKNLEEIRELVIKSGIERIVDDWLNASIYVWNNVEVMSEQLKRYVDNNYREEERRINQIIKNIELNALKIRGKLSKELFFEIEEVSPALKLPFDRKLFTPPKQIELRDEDIEYGESLDSDEVLYSHIYINKDILIENIKEEVDEKGERTLSQIIEQHPLQYGLEELSVYLGIESYKLENVEICVEKQVEYIEFKNKEGKKLRAKLPKIIYIPKEKIHG